MDDQLVILDASTVLVSEPNGDCPPGQDQGLFHGDVRHLSTWQLLVDGEPVRVLASQTTDHHAARVFATLAGARVGHNPTVSIQRHRVVAGGLHQDLVVENHSAGPRAYGWRSGWGRRSRRPVRGQPGRWPQAGPDDRRARPSGPDPSALPATTPPCGS